MLTDAQIRKLESLRVFFGHKSVGENILGGVRERIGADPRLKMNVVKLTDYPANGLPGLVEDEVGENGSPDSKNRAFALELDRGLAKTIDIAMFKYCYVDITASTDVP